MGVQRRCVLALGTAALALILAGLPEKRARAETLTEALARTYVTNPNLNADRARQRAVDEEVPRALSFYRPRVFGAAEAGVQRTITRTPAGTQTSTTFPRGASLTVQQNVFRGFRTQNQVKQAEANVLAGREVLRNTEQNTLLAAVEAYMDVVRDTAILEVRRGNVIFLEETLRATRDRFEVGEVTRTDVAQAEAALSRARANLSVAEANLAANRALYRQIVGVEARNLAPAVPLDRLLPRSLDAAIAIAREKHPAILAASYAVDAAQYAVKIIEGELLPTITVQGDVDQLYDPSENVESRTSASLTARVDVPLYQGGEVSARVQQAKEILGQRKLELDLAREQVQAAVVTAWSDLQSAQAQVVASQAEVAANLIALRGVQEEARVGQRTTLDVLEAQQNLLVSRELLIAAQRDRVVASFALLSAIGNLDAKSLGLPVRKYKPEVYYEEVRDKWFGLRTPTGQ